jgi:hypothetical protein
MRVHGTGHMQPARGPGNCQNGQVRWPAVHASMYGLPHAVHKSLAYCLTSDASPRCAASSTDPTQTSQLSSADRGACRATYGEHVAGGTPVVLPLRHKQPDGRLYPPRCTTFRTANLYGRHAAALCILPGTSASRCIASHAATRARLKHVQVTPQQRPPPQPPGSCDAQGCQLAARRGVVALGHDAIHLPHQALQVTHVQQAAQVALLQRAQPPTIRCCPVGKGCCLRHGSSCCNRGTRRRVPCHAVLAGGCWPSWRPGGAVLRLAECLHDSMHSKHRCVRLPPCPVRDTSSRLVCIPANMATAACTPLKPSTPPHLLIQGQRL